MNILAAFIFFTRLPFWKIREVPAKCFKHVVPYWPLTGWLTGGIMAGTLWLTGQILPVSLAWIIAIIARLLVTGCLHEDGLADFLDGFGGGTTREMTGKAARLASLEGSARVEWIHPDEFFDAAKAELPSGVVE